jgi:hypothetical protein
MNSLLTALEFRQTSRPRRTPDRSSREILISFLDQQIALANAEREGCDLTIQKIRYTKGPDGKPVRTPVNVRPRRHFWEAEGEWLIELRYGNVILELSPGAPAVLGGRSLNEVIATLGKIRDAVEAGEADAAIGAAAAKARRTGQGI